MWRWLHPVMTQSCVPEENSAGIRARVLNRNQMSAGSWSCSLCISATDNCSQCFKKKKTLPAKLHRSCVYMHACVYRAQKISISQQANIHELNNLQLLHSKSLPAAAPLVKKRLDFWLVSLIKMNLLSIFVHSGDVTLCLVGEDRYVGAWQYFKLQQ